MATVRDNYELFGVRTMAENLDRLVLALNLKLCFDFCLVTSRTCVEQNVRGKMSLVCSRSPSESRNLRSRTCLIRHRKFI